MHCDVGFGSGGTAAVSLLAGRGSVVHSFEARAGPAAPHADLLRALFGAGRLVVHAGDARETLPAFAAAGGRCDVAIADICAPWALPLLRAAVRPPGGRRTVLLYTWSHRGACSGGGLDDALRAGWLRELACMRSPCGRDPDGEGAIVREHCAAVLVGDSDGAPPPPPRPPPPGA